VICHALVFFVIFNVYKQIKFGSIFVSFNNHPIRFEKHAPVKSKRTLCLSFKYTACNTVYPKNGSKVTLRSVASQFNVQPTQVRKWMKILDNLNQQLESDVENVQLLQKMDKQTRRKHQTCYPWAGLNLFGSVKLLLVHTIYITCCWIVVQSM
jgi:Brinker DNA-binding domain